MSSQYPDETVTPTATASCCEPPEAETASWAVSLCFWLTLILAAGVYATVALAPKVAVWSQVRFEHRRNAADLIRLEQDVDYLERVQEALETDPEFVERLAGLSQQNADDGQEFIPVSGTLLFGYTAEQADSRLQRPAEPRFHGLIMALATHVRLRTGLLTFAAGLTIFAFAFLNDAGAGLVTSVGQIAKTLVLMPVRRYIRSPADGVLPVAAGDQGDAPTSVSGFADSDTPATDG